MFGNTWQKAAIGVGIGCSFVYGLLLSNVPVVRKIEDRVNDSLILLRKSQKKDEIVLVNLVEKQALLKPSFYADLSERLLKEKAAVVVLNFPHDWQSSTGGEEEIIQLVRKYSDRIVLVVRTAAIGRGGQKTTVPIYSHFIPFKNDTQPEVEVEIEKIQGFFEYELYDKNNELLLNPKRKIQSVGQFIRLDDQKTQIRLKSAAWLSWEKYYNFLYKKELPTKPPSGHINFAGKTNTFQSIDIDNLCFTATPDQCIVTNENKQNFEIFRNKIVLIGATQQKDYLSVAGKKMPALEVQANLINSLMTKSLYNTANNFVHLGIVLCGVIIISKFIISGITKPGYFHQKWGILPILGVMGGYGSLYLLCFYNWLIFPIALPMSIWLVTGISLTACLWIAQLLKQDELKQRQLAEKKAAALHARKLLYRIASDIHDHPLQELKVVMDRIELWQFDNPSLNTEPILEKLLEVNRDIRTQLNDIRTIADKLKLTPELRSGLDVGIRSRLGELVNSGELTLKVVDDIQSLQEPWLDSAWIDAREDIFRFFREAIANVIRHAQPPQGNATTVKVSLFQSGAECAFILENDGFFVDSFVSKSHGGGYGTKMMETIAMELPGGKWERFTLDDGGMIVKLVWKFRQSER